MSNVATASVVVSLALLSILPARAQIPTRVGGEFQVNSYTTGYQGYAAAATRSDGGFVIAWMSQQQDGSSNGVFLRSFDASGDPQAVELQISTYTEGGQQNVAVAMRGAGDFVVAWDDQGRDGSGNGVFARRFDAAGAPQAVEIQVNSYTEGGQRFPAVAMANDGGFVVAWVDQSGLDGYQNGVFARRFDAAGAPQAVELQVNSYTEDLQDSPAVAMTGAGAFVIAWRSRIQDGGSAGGIFAQRFDSAGTPQGAELQVNSYTAGTQGDPAVAIDGAGDFVVAWDSSGQDGLSGGVFAQRFDSAGTPQAVEFQVAVHTSGNEGDSAVAFDGSGFVVVWDRSSGQIYARRFNAAGPVGGELLVNSYTTGYRFLATIGGNGEGDFVVAWTGGPGQDGSSYGVFAQRLETPGIVLDIDGNGSVGALTDGLLVLRFLFGFTGPTLVTGAYDPVGCTRCDAPSMEAYLGTLI